MLRIKLRYDDLEAMVQRFAPNVGKSGLFLPTKSLQPVGAEIKFELRLTTDQPALVGMGRVKAAKPPDPDDPKATFGMAIELMRVTRESRDLILQMLDHRRVLGLADVAIPMPADMDAARQALGSDGKSAIATPPAGVPTQIAPSDSMPEALLTAPRRITGPIVAVKDDSVAPLPPEPARRKRPAVHEVIEAASGPIAAATVSVPGLDDDVDVASILARARALAGGDLDAELDALRETAAAPLSIDVEAASAELAKQLGGAAVRRDRSARWAPPPPSVSEAVSAPEPEAVPAPVPAPVPDPAPVADVDTPVTPESALAPTDDAEAGDDMFADVSEVMPEVDAEPAVPRAESEPSFEEVESTQIGDNPVPTAVDPAAFDHHDDATRPSDDESILARRLEAQLAEAEAEADDDLGIGAAFDRVISEHGEVDTPDPERAFIHHFRLPTADPHYHDREPSPIEERLPADQRFHEAETYTPEGHAADDDREHEHRLYGEGVEDLATTHGRNTGEPELPPGGYAAGAVVPVEDDEDLEEIEEIEEIDEFEIIAEADEGDADLLAAHGEVDAAASGDAPPPRPSHSDFASRLALDEDESDLYPALPEHDASDPRARSAGLALAAFDDEDSLSGFDPPSRPSPARVGVRPIYDDNGSTSYTLAGDLDDESLDLAPPPVGFPPLHQFDQSDVIEVEPPAPRRRAGRIVEHEATPTPTPGHRTRGARPISTARVADPEDDELESALEALDVDLDDLSMPHASTELSRDGRGLPVRGRPTIRPASDRQSGPQRRTTEDGVLIDFDDDD
ncbi:MAG TPA: hypothetical protein VFQ53_20215 [Kofleriaceae bacterium]|nr:hypothetical protein [Kofleriaceae bacterium]